MKPFDQRNEDPHGYYLSIAIVCGLFSVGAFLDGGALGIVGFVAVVVAAGVFLLAHSFR